jgi:CheY-like chemotaxis protein
VGGEADPRKAMAIVLIIDDDPQIRCMLGRVLRRADHQVLEAADGNEGLAACRRRRPDVVLTDIVMPEKEGIGTIVELRREWPELPIIAMSGAARYGGRDYLDAARHLGAARALEKPFLPRQVLEAIEELLADDRAAG